jgi:putative DNA methylase
MFSGRGIIPLEAARAGATAVGTDLSPVATLAGRLLAEWPMREWDAEPVIPFRKGTGDELDLQATPRLPADAEALHDEIDNRVKQAVAAHFPAGPNGHPTWAYLWLVTMPCDGCARRFPLFGMSTLRHPNNRSNDSGQAFRLLLRDGGWAVEVHDGAATQEPTYSSSGRKGKSARCPFCQHVHSLETVKAKGFAGQYQDEPVIAADYGGATKKVFRVLTDHERLIARNARLGTVSGPAGLSGVPDEDIPRGNVHTIQASGYGYTNYGNLMCGRQSLLFAEYARTIRDCHAEMVEAGLSSDYATALTSLAAATLIRMLKYATRGARLRCHGSPDGSKNNNVQVDHIFASEAVLVFQFDFLEVGISDGPGSWAGLARTGLKPLMAHLRGASAEPARLRRANAMALPFRDATIDAIVTDPPYYDTIEYADASDYFYVWLRRVLADIQPDLFGDTIGTQVAPNLQNKDDEIIVRRVYNGGVKHDRDFYEASLSRAFGEARRVLRPDGHMVVVFGHSDPEAWKRLLGALHDAEFVVTSSWPSRTETSNTGVASIKVTVTIGCRVASAGRRTGPAEQVDREVIDAVKAMVPQWDADGLALQDQMMAAYGPAMEVYGRYSRVIRPDGTEPSIDDYLRLARKAVRDATALKLDTLPLETFDRESRVAVFILRAYRLTDVPKGETVFLAQVDGLKTEDLRDRILTETRSGFRLRLDAPEGNPLAYSTWEVVRGLAAAWQSGGTEAAAAVVVAADRLPTDDHVWALVGEIQAQLPDSDVIGKALAAVKRNRDAIIALAQRMMDRTAEPVAMTLFGDGRPDEEEEA